MESALSFIAQIFNARCEKNKPQMFKSSLFCSEATKNMPFECLTPVKQALGSSCSKGNQKKPIGHLQLAAPPASAACDGNAAVCNARAQMSLLCATKPKKSGGLVALGAPAKKTKQSAAACHARKAWLV